MASAAIKKALITLLGGRGRVPSSAADLDARLFREVAGAGEVHVTRHALYAYLVKHSEAGISRKTADKLFLELDVDGDGKLTEDEFMEVRAGGMYINMTHVTTQVVGQHAHRHPRIIVWGSIIPEQHASHSPTHCRCRCYAAVMACCRRGHHGTTQRCSASHQCMWWQAPAITTCAQGPPHLVWRLSGACVYMLWCSISAMFMCPAATGVK